MSSSNIKYSVIIPHYRSLELLNRCVESIPNNDTIQVIIIDDNSGIDTNCFMKIPSLKRQNVSLYFRDKGGSAGAARNIGLEQAYGKWLIFADADDFFLDNAFDLFNQYYESPYDIVYFGVRSKDSDTGEDVDRYKIYNKYVEACDNKSLESINAIRFRHDVPWGKMIKRELVTKYNIRFSETRYCNDTIFSTLSGLYARSIYVEHRPTYCVTTCEGSLTTHKSLSATLIRYEIILQKNKILITNHYRKYQLPLIGYYKEICSYGIVPLFKSILLAFKYRVNPFIGLRSWILRHF